MARGKTINVLIIEGNDCLSPVDKHRLEDAGVIVVTKAMGRNVEMHWIEVAKEEEQNG